MNEDSIKIGDFGLAHAFEDKKKGHVRSEKLVAASEYLSAEIMRDHESGKEIVYSKESDIW